MAVLNQPFSQPKIKVPGFNPFADAKSDYLRLYNTNYLILII
uniref:Uncharacterized protein n=1 Tax=Anguilla anguilla TaxID=7936 RepID=A0A0E9R1D0_ANGAN